MDKPYLYALLIVAIGEIISRVFKRYEARGKDVTVVGWIFFLLVFLFRLIGF